MLHSMDEPLQLVLRVLQDDGDDTNTTVSPSPTPAPPSAAPVPDDKDAAQNFTFFFFTIVVVVGGFMSWRCFVLWRRSRERRMMALQSARADTVLGDMQVGYFPSSSGSSRLRALVEVYRHLTFVSLFPSRWYQMMSTMTTIRNFCRWGFTQSQNEFNHSKKVLFFFVETSLEL
jgi:hypothetical protein